KGIRSAGIIILITGGGGAFGMLIRDSGVGTVIAEAMVETSLPAILLPFLIATIIRFIQGSGTVAMITAASITAPIIANMSVNPVFAALAACVGSLFYSYLNDSFFWVVNRSVGITEGREQLRLYSVASTIAWAIGIVVLLILNALFG
ncbi:MAG: GntP family permease, partial [Selenomonas sp.]|nr:GntP family permease [Selenomonas sp.]